MTPMLKNHSSKFEILHKLIDLGIINASWWICYYLRFEADLLSADKGLLIWYFKFSVLLTFMSYYYFRREGLYSSKRFSPLWNEILGVIKANVVSFTIFIVLGYFLSHHKISRLFIIFHFMISTFGLVAFKVFLRRTLKELRKTGKNLRTVLLVGNNKHVIEYAQRLKKHPEYGISIIKWINDLEEIKSLTAESISKHGADSIVFGLENEHYHVIKQILIDLNNSLADIVILPDLSHSLVGYQIVDISGMTAILINEPNIRSRSVILKRFFDIIISTIGLIVVSPLMIVIAALIKMKSKGPIFYSQIRMGLDGKEFKMWKLRSMTTCQTMNQETWTQKNDPRVTSIGKFIRKTSIDELPQLFNVFIGDMSIVGPRPERPIYVNMFREKIPTYMLRHKMKAGITGWAQINGWRGDTSIESRIECDLYYIKNWSIWMDCWIILLTFWKGFVHKNAY
jgi:Undecaprenyl-phosphate glucose phosphotransferase